MKNDNFLWFAILIMVINISSYGQGTGPAFEGKRNVIGYVPSWKPNFSANEYDATKLTHAVASFLVFRKGTVDEMNGNQDYTSDNFMEEIKFTDASVAEVDFILADPSTNILQKSKAAGTKIMIGIGGATDFGFIWLMENYYNNNEKLEEIADVMIAYVDKHNLDGIDLDMECWWANPDIQKSGYGGRNRSGATDEGPHPAALGITNLAKKLKEKRPSMIVSSVVFATSWYGNNYDNAMADYMDWVSVFTYDLTGSWNASPVGPHSALRPLSDPNITTIENALTYWSNGIFTIERNKLCIGAPFYGYDFNVKPVSGPYPTMTYRDIINTYPNAPTAYYNNNQDDANGNININGEANIFYETPARIRKKVEFLYQEGYQGIILWELTQDVQLTDENKDISLLYAVSDENDKQCDADPNCDNTLSIPNVADADRISLYTVDNTVYFDFTTSVYPTKNLQVFDLAGRNIMFKNITEKKGSFDLNISKGLYMIAVESFSKLVYIK